MSDEEEDDDMIDHDGSESEKTGASAADEDLSDFGGSVSGEVVMDDDVGDPLTSRLLDFTGDNVCRTHMRLTVDGVQVPGICGAERSQCKRSHDGLGSG
jgi:hypothetical protein